MKGNQFHVNSFQDKELTPIPSHSSTITLLPTIAAVTIPSTLHDFCQLKFQIQ